jgi:NADH dehydrogenase [ubiquinone] 1 alpha subcomplex assembly factor 1
VPTPRIAFSYRAAFQTQKDQWQEVAVPLSKFQATSFGRVTPNTKPVDPADVNSIGLLLADKKAGSFKLEVDWIKVTQKPKAR